MSTSVVDNWKEDSLAAFRTLVRAHLYCTTGKRKTATAQWSSVVPHVAEHAWNEDSARIPGFLESPSCPEMGSGVSSRNLPLPQQSASRLPQQQ